MKIKLFSATILFLLIFFGLPANVLAAPSISSASGSFIHGQNITISGSAFGTKNPVAPLMWDDAEDRVVDDQSSVLSKGWVDLWPRSGVSSLEHRIKYRNAGYRNVTGPHSRSTKFLAGGHYQTPDNNPPYIGTGAEDYRNVSATVDAGSGKPRWFAVFYYRLDPLWISGCPTWNNDKTSVIQSAAASYTGANSYICYRSQSPECVANPQFALPSNLGILNYGIWPADFPSTNNPRTQWVHYEERISDDSSLGFRNLYIDNMPALITKNNAVDWFNGQGGNFATGIRSYSIGGYYRWGTDINDVSTYRGDVNNFRYFDDMYIDNSLSRVMLANNANYDSATIIEPQIPSAWSDGSITAKVNLGKLPDSGTAYLFVFDSNNEYNSVGYPVTLGSSSGDTTPPAAPAGLTVQ